MSGTMKYRGYVRSVDFSEEDGVLFGKILGIRSPIMYEGKDCEALVADFHEAVDDYLLACEEHGIEPEVPYKGSFNVRITPVFTSAWRATRSVPAGASTPTCTRRSSATLRR